MNERIQELAMRANSHHDNSFDLNYKELDVFLSKFAELIVQECIEQLVKEGDAWEQFSRNPTEGQESNAGAALFAAYRLKEDAVSRLEEHFGVTE